MLGLDIKLLNFLDLKNRLGILFIANVLRKLIDLIKPDLIHVHSLLHSANLALRIINPPIPIIITDHGAYWGIKEEGRRALLRLGISLSIADRIICVSNHVREKLLSLYPVLSKYFPVLPSPNDIVVIHNPIDISRFHLPDPERVEELKRRVGEGGKIVFFCAVTEPIRRKRLDLLLKAFAIDDRLRSSCKLVIVTNEEGVLYVKEFVSRNKLELLVLSKIPWRELVKYYAMADVFVMPSYAEPFGLVYAEALALGTPIVGSYESVKELEELLGVYVGEKFDPRHEGEKN